MIPDVLYVVLVCGQDVAVLLLMLGAVLVSGDAARSRDADLCERTWEGDVAVDLMGWSNAGPYLRVVISCGLCAVNVVSAQVAIHWTAAAPMPSIPPPPCPPVWSDYGSVFY